MSGNFSVPAMMTVNKEAAGHGKRVEGFGTNFDTNEGEKEWHSVF